MLTQSLPYWPINPSISSGPWFNFQLDFVRSLWAMLPGAILWGASFPLALASVANGRQDPARLVGGVYAANTLGAIIGSLGASLLLVIWLGSQRAQQLLIVLSGAVGAAGARAASADAANSRRRRAACVRRHAADLAAAMGGAVARAQHAASSRGCSWPTAGTRRRARQADVIYMRRRLERVGRGDAPARTAC